MNAERWFLNPEIIEAGHAASKKSLNGNGRDRFMVMSAWENRFISEGIEHLSKGGSSIEMSGAVNIKGHSH